MVSSPWSPLSCLLVSDSKEEGNTAWGVLRNCHGEEVEDIYKLAKECGGRRGYKAVTCELGEGKYSDKEGTCSSREKSHDEEHYDMEVEETCNGEETYIHGICGGGDNPSLELCGQTCDAHGTCGGKEEGMCSGTTILTLQGGSLLLLLVSADSSRRQTAPL